MPYLTAAVLFVVFALAAYVAPYLAVLGLVVGVPLGRTRYAANIVHTLDMLLAAIFGWNGRATVSKECGQQIIAGNPCRFCRIVCAVLSYKVLGRWHVLEPDHCRKEVERG